jgi:hypothetical protein
MGWSGATESRVTTSQENGARNETTMTSQPTLKTIFAESRRSSEVDALTARRQVLAAVVLQRTHSQPAKTP